MRRPLERQMAATGNAFARILIRALRFILASFAGAVLCYAVFAAVYDTDEEKTLKEENGVLMAEYDAMTRRTALLDDVVDGIVARDEAVYASVFNSSIPDYIVNSVTTSGLDFSEMVSESETNLINRTNASARRSEYVAGRVGFLLDSLSAEFSEEPQKIRSLPSIAPVEGFSIGQSGASCGSKYNPFFKTPGLHSGFDIMAPSGAEVLATADGRVSMVRMNKRGDGKVVEITHAGGYKTIYRHLGEVNVVTGRIVRRGSVIGRVGMSGRSFAPHLHYEVVLDGENQDPVHFFFASGLDAVSCAKMLLMASTTGQSMD